MASQREAIFVFRLLKLMQRASVKSPRPIWATFGSDRLSHSLAPLSLPLILGFSCVAMAWLIPGHYIPWPSFQHEATTAVAFVLIALAALMTGRTVWPPLAWGVAIAALIPWFQWAGGLIIFRSDALLPSVYLFASAACIAAGATLAHSNKRDQLINGWVASILFAGLISVGLALWQWLTRSGWEVGWETIIEPIPFGARPYANLAQPNHLSTLLALALVAVLIWYEKQRIGGLTATFAALWLGWGIVLTQSRTGWLFVALLVIWCLLMKRRAGLRLPMGVVVFGALLFLAAVPATKWLEQAIWADPLGIQLRGVEGGRRWIHWQVLLDAAWRSPWVGYGWNQVALAQYASVMHYPRTWEALTHSHNLIIDLLVENGLIVGTVLVAGLAAWFANSIAKCRDSDHWALLAAIAAIFLHALFEYPLHYLNFLLPASLLMGVITPVGGVYKTLPKAWLAVLIAGLFFVLAGIASEYLRAEESMRKLRLANARIGPVTLPDIHFPSLVWLDSWDMYFATANPRGGGLTEHELDMYRHLALRFTYRRSVLVYARVAALNGREAEAEHVLAYLCHVQAESACREERQLWSLAQEKEPELRRVNFPAVLDR